jgi:hypothetical protein
MLEIIRKKDLFSVNKVMVVAMRRSKLQGYFLITRYKNYQLALLLTYMLKS